MTGPTQIVLCRLLSSTVEIGLHAVAVHLVIVNFAEVDTSIDFHQTLLIVVYCMFAAGLSSFLFPRWLANHVLIPRASVTAVLTKHISQIDTDQHCDYSNRETCLTERGTLCPIPLKRSRTKWAVFTAQSCLSFVVFPC